ncbi:MAG: hypothetical protein ACRCVN_04295 [Spirochaetia bacterium]
MYIDRNKFFNLTAVFLYMLSFFSCAIPGANRVYSTVVVSREWVHGLTWYGAMEYYEFTTYDDNRIDGANMTTDPLTTQITNYYTPIFHKGYNGYKKKDGTIVFSSPYFSRGMKYDAFTLLSNGNRRHYDYHFYGNEILLTKTIYRPIREEDLPDTVLKEALKNR